MADYTETFTKVDGNVIEAADFNTEFVAIEAAIATKADVDSDTLTNLTIGSGFSGGAIVSGTTKTLSGGGLTQSWTSIPSWVKKITVGLHAVSPDSTGSLVLRIGDSGGLESTGYINGTSFITGTNTCDYTTSSITTGFRIHPACVAGTSISGQLTLALLDATTNTWTCQGVVVDEAGQDYVMHIGGSKQLSGTLDRVGLVQAAPSTDFDAGIANIIYEG